MKEFKEVLRIQTTALKALHDYLYEKDCVQVLPVMLSKTTDPLSHSVFDAEIDYYGDKYSLTKSMIFQKQLLAPHFERVFVFSPNVRLEKEEKRHGGKHLIEFSQLDMEFQGASKEEFMSFVEEMLCLVVKRVKKERAKELEVLGRKLETPRTPFKRMQASETIEEEASLHSSEPFWLLGHEREFYDKWEHNYDLIYPEGFGEALSGGEREWETKEIKRKMLLTGKNLAQYEEWLEASQHFVPSAGGGLGIERLVRWLSGKKALKKSLHLQKYPARRKPN